MVIVGVAREDRLTKDDMKILCGIFLTEKLGLGRRETLGSFMKKRYRVLYTLTL